MRNATDAGLMQTPVPAAPGAAFTDAILRFLTGRWGHV